MEGGRVLRMKGGIVERSKTNKLESTVLHTSLFLVPTRIFP